MAGSSLYVNSLKQGFGELFAIRAAFRFNRGMISDPHTHTEAGCQDNPLANFMGKMGPCEKPCDGCDEPCDERVSTATGRWAQWLKDSLINTLDICFDDVYQEPKKILIVGGCRQMDLSQHIALLLPAAEITLVDPDEAVAAKAKEEVCCRFKFIPASLEALPFERETFDLTIAHNFMAYPDDWKLALAELGRVTRGNLFISQHRPLVWGVAKRFGVLRQAMQSLGIEMPARLPDQFTFLSALYDFAKVKTKLAPFPWTVYMAAVNPRWEEKQVLAS